ncbi:MAG: hypothetical protein GW893_23145, partial [Armatimonadetes bacterium]|nr:hypothetical protein [Armatimonadota bacterium]
MKSLRSPILFLALLVVAGGALLLLRSSVQGTSGNYQVRLDAQGSPRESIVASIAKTEGLSRTGAEQLLEKSESKLGYKVFDRLNLPAN